jgi:DNA topoisomerase IA
VERERDIQNFNAIASYSIVAEFTNETGKSFKAKLPKNFNTKKEAEDFLNNNIGSTYKVADLETKPTKKSPTGPFTTVTTRSSQKIVFTCWNYHAISATFVRGRTLYMRNGCKPF